MENAMVKYILNKAGQALAVIVLVTFLVFALVSLIPGNAVSLMLGIDSSEAKNQELLSEYNLDKPVYEQYWLWLRDLLHGDLGDSWSQHVPVAQLLAKRMAISLRIGAVALAISTVLGVFLGFVAAKNHGRTLDRMIGAGASLGVSIPAFWSGILMILVFSVWLKLLPVQGYTAPEKDYALHVKQMIMPCLVTAFGALPPMILHTRSAVLEILQQKYIRTCYSKGLPRRYVFINYILRNVLIPLLTFLGMQLRVLFGGVIIVENIFNIPGMGNLLVTSMNNRDLPTIQGCILVMAIVVVLTNFVLDALYGLIDPRIRTGKEAHNE